MKIEKFCVAMCVLALAVSFAGCKKSGIPGLVPAEGVVTLNGAPVEGATVIFTPKKVDMSSEASSATAMTNAQGKFKMQTRGCDGIFPSEYNVIVQKNRVEGVMSLEEGAKILAEGGSKSNRADAPPQTLIRELPAIYDDMSAPVLEAIVPEKGSKELNFALEGEVDTTPIDISSGGRGSAPGQF